MCKILKFFRKKKTEEAIKSDTEQNIKEDKLIIKGLVDDSDYINNSDDNKTINGDNMKVYLVLQNMWHLGTYHLKDSYIELLSSNAEILVERGLLLEEKRRSKD